MTKEIEATQEQWAIGTHGPNAHYLRRVGGSWEYTLDPAKAETWGSRAEAAHAANGLRGLFSNATAIRL